MRMNYSYPGLLIAALLLQSAYGGGSEPPPPTELVKRLHSHDEHTRLDAERSLLRLKADAAEALLHATCRTPAPRHNVVAATRRILGAWEEESWTNPQSAAAVDRFVQLARDLRNTSGEDVPLGPRAAIPFATLVRVLDVTPDAAAAFLSAKPGIKVAQDRNGFYTSVSLGSKWVVEPKDWRYIANLAREIPVTPYTNGRCHPISISVVASLDGDTLAECLRYLRKSMDSPIDLFFQQARINRECLVVLRSYRELTGLSANQWNDDITDEVWATSISTWPNCSTLALSASASTKTIAAASKLENLLVVRFMNSGLTERDLAPLRQLKKLNSLWVSDAEVEELYRTRKAGWEVLNPYVEYLNQQGTGKWQLDAAKRGD